MDNQIMAEWEEYNATGQEVGQLKHELKVTTDILRELYNMAECYCSNMSKETLVTDGPCYWHEAESTIERNEAILNVR